MEEHPLVKAVREGIEDLRSGRELRRWTVAVQRTPQELQKQYLAARNRLAIAVWLMIVLGWMLGEFLVHGRTGILPVVGGIATGLGVVGGVLLLVAGNIVLRRRFRS